MGYTDCSYGKKSESVRICGDFRISCNPLLSLHRYPLPKVHEFHDILGKGKMFSSVDLAEAYHQIPLDEAAQNIFVINTHKGLFKYKRLPYGVS